ncbi:PQQ-binding-like beta-propeller repeat protein [Methanocalculus taiwanensis]|uniref:PQQ-binding-like beta-propeller repeat protein n=1 Tax=Methanocalculus taiwanensis TaxID=106207 RepID=A0ABD4TKC1_9EURY|nr:hypothetical protein [Methanocalculus taiwanensis]MCQ1539256.1 PQQ-binding-like beta-propeller repeat protein [Methanocalculus taiwanensis]
MNPISVISKKTAWILLLIVCITGLSGAVTAVTIFSDEQMNVTYSLAQYTDIFVIEEAYNGGFLIGGHAYSPDTDRHAFLMKTDPYGEEIWSQMYKGKRIVAINELDDGRILVASVNDWVHPESPTAAITGTGYLILTDQLGNIIWCEESAGNAPAAIIVQNDDILLAGWKWAPVDDPEGISGFLEHYTFDGEFMNSILYEGVSIHDIRKTDDGGYLIIGNTGNPIETPYVRYGHMTKIDSSGEVTWRKTFDERSLFAMSAMNDGYLIVGGTHPYGYSEGEAWALGVSQDGELIWEEKLQGYAAYGVAPYGEHYIVAGVTGPGNPLIALIGTDGTTIDSKRLLDAEGRFTAVKVLTDNRVAVGGWSRHTGEVEGWFLTFDPYAEPVEQQPIQSPGFGIIIAAAFGTVAAATLIHKRKRD